MTRFLRGRIPVAGLDKANYALKPRCATDLSLVTGPWVWDGVVAGALADAERASHWRYRSPGESPELLAAIASREGLQPGQLWLTAGADHAIELVLERFLGPGDILAVVVPNFPRFEIVARALPGVVIRHCSSIDAIDADAAMAVICTPCNPTTGEVDEAALRSVLAARPDVLFCLDAVFSWYAGWEPAALCRDFDNVLVLKSYSKLGLAGIRLGYVAGEAALVADLKAARSPFFVGDASQRIALAVERQAERIALIRDWIATRGAALQAAFGPAMRWDTPVPFYCLRTGREAAKVVAELADAGIGVVDSSRFAGMPADALRVAIGEHEQNELLIRVVRERGILGGN